jgi:hypothetical protein
VSETVKEILNRQWSGGTRVTNCVVHISRPLDERPHTCDLCRTDLENQFRYALRVNEFLNKIVDDAKAAL